MKELPDEFLKNFLIKFLKELLEKFPKNLLKDFPMQLPGLFLKVFSKQFSLDSTGEETPLEFIGVILEKPTGGIFQKKN